MESSPAALRDAATELRTLAGGIDHPECVAWFEGRVHCGTESGDLLAVDPATGAREVLARTGGWIIGIAFDGDGNCYACDIANGRIVRVDRAGGCETFVEAVEGRRLSMPNYLAFDDRGQLWGTDSGTAWGSDDGFLFRVDSSGGASLADDVCRRFPNGLAVSRDGDRLYLVESRLPGVVEYPLEDGVLGARRDWLQLPGTVPDGLAVDTGGAVYVACWRPDRVYLREPSGELRILLDDPTGEYLTTATNLCFDEAGRTLFIAGLGGWEIRALEVDVPGLPPRRPLGWRQRGQDVPPDNQQETR